MLIIRLLIIVKRRLRFLVNIYAFFKAEKRHLVQWRRCSLIGWLIGLRNVACTRCWQWLQNERFRFANSAADYYRLYFISNPCLVLQIKSEKGVLSVESKTQACLSFWTSFRNLTLPCTRPEFNDGPAFLLSCNSKTSIGFCHAYVLRRHLCNEN